MKNKKYPFNENIYLQNVKEYILKCNDRGHYKRGKDSIHTFELIARGKYNRGLHFCISNIMKYSDRFETKGGANKLDIMKIIHYGILSLYCMDEHFDDTYSNLTNEDIIDVQENSYSDKIKKKHKNVKRNKLKKL